MQGAVITSNASVFVDVNLTEGEAKVTSLQERIDQQQRDWEEKRREILQQMNAIGRGINLTIQAVRTTARLTGQALSPMYNALLSLVGSTTSLVLSTATILAASSLGVLAGVSIAISTAAITFSAIQSAKLIADSEDFKNIIAGIEQQLANIRFAGSL